MTVKILIGDCRNILRTLDPESVHCVVTSPPYWGLRDYGVEPSIWGGDQKCKHKWNEQRWYTEQSAAKSDGSSEAFSKPGEANKKRLKDARWRTAATCKNCGAWQGAFGLEPTPDEFVSHAVEIFREVHRVLRKDGTLWLNLGDSYNNLRIGQVENSIHKGKSHGRPINKKRGFVGLKEKDLIGIPWRVAFALRADGWYLRQDIIWSKPNPMPESVRDRCTKAHEYLFLLSKSERYHYDAEAIAEASAAIGPSRGERKDAGEPMRHGLASAAACGAGGFGAKDGKRNKRSVWEVSTQSFSEAHFATFPPALIEPCIMAGCPKGGTVLDPFGGAGTTGMVADRLGRNSVLIELNPKYAAMAERRIKADKVDATERKRVSLNPDKPVQETLF